MQIPNANLSGRSNDPVWQFLAEYPLREYLSDHDEGCELTAGLLFQTILDLDVPPECISKIEKTLIEFVKLTKADSNQDRRDFPIVIHLFCQKSKIQDASVAKTERALQARQTIEPTQPIHSANTKIYGGWGFFLIERPRDFSSNPSLDAPSFIDLYLYQEGE